MSYAPLGEGNQLRSVPSASEDDLPPSSSASSLRLVSSSSSSLRRTNKNNTLSEPLTSHAGDDGGTNEDPYYVFREDLYRKLDILEESLAEYLRIIHQTVRDVL
jgi:hypothetical protein